MAVDGRDFQGISQTQGIKFINIRVDATHGVAFVDRQNHRLPGPLQNRRHSGIRDRQAHFDVGDHDNGVGQFNANFA